MGVKHYELTQAQWERIAPMLPGKVGDPGRSGVDTGIDRQVDPIIAAPLPRPSATKEPSASQN